MTPGTSTHLDPATATTGGPASGGKLQPMAMACQLCDHTWVETFELPMAAGAFSDRLKGMSRCPSCGKRPRRNAKKTIVLLTGPRARAVVAAWRARMAADLTPSVVAETKGSRRGGTR